MAVLRIRDESGKLHTVRALKGEAGAGVHVGSYVGNCPADASVSQYVDLGSPHVTAVLLQTAESLLLVTEEVVSVNGVGVAALISGTEMGRGDHMFLSVHRPLTNQMGVTFSYLAFIGEAAE